MGYWFTGLDPLGWDGTYPWRHSHRARLDHLEASDSWSWRTLDTRLHPQEKLLHHESIEQVPLLHGNVDLLRANWRADDGAADNDWPSTSFATTALVLWIGFVLLVLYLVSLLVAFEQLVPASATFLSVMLIPLAGFVSMHSLGETDNGAALAID